MCKSNRKESERWKKTFQTKNPSYLVRDTWFNTNKGLCMYYQGRNTVSNITRFTGPAMWNSVNSIIATLTLS